jgi:hypothetical protein
MNKTIKIKQGDTYPPIEATFIDETKKAINLTNATVVFTMANNKGNPKINKKPVAIIDAIQGKVKYSWQPTDTDTSGTYQAEFVITFEDNSILTVPTTDSLMVEIIKKISVGGNGHMNGNSDASSNVSGEISVNN